MKNIKFLLVLLLAVVLMVGCGNNNENPNSSGNKNSSKNKVTFCLDWTPNVNHTGVYVAKDLGYYEEAGIDVDIIQPADGDVEAIVASGKSDFGVSFQDNIAQARTNGVNVTSVMAIRQHNGSGIMSRKGDGIDRPKGLEGRTYASWELPIEQAIIKNIVETDGGDPSKVIIVPSTVNDEVAALDSKAVDALWIYYGWGGVRAEVEGFDFDYFDFISINPVFDFYTPVIISNDELIKENPELVNRFVDATLKGFQYCIDNPKEAADILLKNDPSLDAEFVHAAQEFIGPEFKADAEILGIVDETRWSRFYEWLNENDLLVKDIDPMEGFTNEFVLE